MLRFRLLVALTPVVALITNGACGGREAAHLGLVMEAPEGLLDQANTVTLSVFDVGSSKCEADGAVSNAPATGARTFSLSQKGLSQGTTWCTTIDLDRDGSNKMFSVVAQNASGKLAQGCTTATIDQDPLSVTITVERFVEPGCCNDGTVQVGEQCDTGMPMGCDGSPAGKCDGITADAVCDCNCQAQEILLSGNDSDQPFIANGVAGSKTNLALAFTAGNLGLDRALRAVYVNTGVDAKGGADILERFLEPDLNPFTDPYPLKFQLVMPVVCDHVQDTMYNGPANHQDSPAVAAVGAFTTTVYRSDENQGGNYDIFLVAQTGDGCADSPACTAGQLCPAGTCSGGFCPTSEQISVPGTVPGASAPAIAAGTATSALVVWNVGANVFARIWNTDGSLAPSVPILIAPTGSAARVAGNANGWQVVYQGSGGGDSDGIFMKTVDTTGTLGTEVKVNAVTAGLQDQPDIAMLDDGRTMVVWHSGGDVFFQRFSATGGMVTDDQNAPLNTVTDGDQQHPRVAASLGVGEFFTVAWETIESANISARFVGGSSGFGYNSVDGQNGEFVATHPAFVPPDAQRHKPAVAVGGAGYVVIGWRRRRDDAPRDVRAPLPASDGAVGDGSAARPPAARDGAAENLGWGFSTVEEAVLVGRPRLETRRKRD